MSSHRQMQRDVTDILIITVKTGGDFNIYTVM